MSVGSRGGSGSGASPGGENWGQLGLGRESPRSHPEQGDVAVAEPASLRPEDSGRSSSFPWSQNIGLYVEVALCGSSLGSGVVMGGRSKSGRPLLSPYGLGELGCLVTISKG